MPNSDKWVISSSGRHMFVSFSVADLVSRPGFTAKIHYGNEINDIKNFASKNIDLFSVNCANVINGQIGFCACHTCSELEGDCDFNDQCREGLRCGSNNCPASIEFDGHTDCCYEANVGDENFCITNEPCEVNEGDCDSNEECKSHLFCGSNNCPASLGFSSSVDCCEPKGDKTLYFLSFGHCPYNLNSFSIC